LIGKEHQLTFCSRVSEEKSAPAEFKCLFACLAVKT